MWLNGPKQTASQAVGHISICIGIFIKIFRINIASDMVLFYPENPDIFLISQ